MGCSWSLPKCSIASGRGVLRVRTGGNNGGEAGGMGYVSGSGGQQHSAGLLHDLFEHGGGCVMGVAT